MSFCISWRFILSRISIQPFYGNQTWKEKKRRFVKIEFNDQIFLWSYKKKTQIFLSITMLLKRIFAWDTLQNIPKKLNLILGLN